MKLINKKNRGFLFTISIIMFASTLIFFTQNYSSLNASNEAAIISSAKPLGVVMLNDDIGFSLGRIFDTSLDANSGPLSTDLLVSGSISSSPSISDALSGYNSALSDNLFPLLYGQKSVLLDDLRDGKAEAFFADNFEFDYNYDSQEVELFPTSGSALLGIDLNLQVHKDLNRYEWTSGPVSGSAILNFTYTDDSNYFSIAQGLSPTDLSTLVLYYSDSNITLNFGATRVDADSSVKISNNSDKKLVYSIKSSYANADEFPIFWNGRLLYSWSGFDSNSRIFIRK